MYGLIKMKNKRWCVTYSYRTHFDTTIAAPTSEEAQRKVKEVLGDVKFEGTWEVYEKTKKETINK